MANAEHMGFDAPEEVRDMPLGRAEIIKIGGGQVMRMTLQPGWRWSEHVKPIAGTELCQAPHFQYSVSGRIGVRMADGTEFEVGPERSACWRPVTTRGSWATNRWSRSTGAARTSGRSRRKLSDGGVLVRLLRPHRDSRSAPDNGSPTPLEDSRHTTTVRKSTSRLVTPMRRQRRRAAMCFAVSV